ncbi:MAG: hypothetical protein ACOYID_00980 [Eubacteriales bacterium]|jgi:hypothetical protein|nr:hypothetical protein [Clostridiales bacterium]
MTLELGHLCGSPEEVVKIKRDVIVHFDEELSFLASLPTVLETPSFVFMYGGLRDRCIADNRKRSVMELTKYDRFMETEQAGSADSININWASCDVEVLHTEGSFTYIRHVASGKKTWVPSHYIYDGCRCDDYTDYVLPVGPGDALALPL